MSLDPDAPAAAAVLQIDDPETLSARLAQGGRAVVFFAMSGCPYCVPYMGRFAELAASRPDLGLLRVSLDDPRSPLWEKYAIAAVPTFIAFEHGEILARADSILALGLSRRRWDEFLAAL